MRLISPVPEKDLDLVWGLLSEEFRHQTLDDLSPKNLEELTQMYERGKEANGQSFAAYDDFNMFIGAIWFDNLSDGKFIGHLVFERDYSPQNKLFATRQALLILFGSGARKVTWPFFADNRAFRIFLKKLGAEYEGTMRQQERRNGELVDVTFMASFPKDK